MVSLNGRSAARRSVVARLLLSCLHVEGMLERLRKADKGCYYIDRFAAALFYADDMAILAPSAKGIMTLQSLLPICGEYCIEFDTCLNA